MTGNNKFICRKWLGHRREHTKRNRLHQSQRRSEEVRTVDLLYGPEQVSCLLCSSVVLGLLVVWLTPPRSSARMLQTIIVLQYDKKQSSAERTKLISVQFRGVDFP